MILSQVLTLVVILADILTAFAVHCSVLKSPKAVRVSSVRFKYQFELILFQVLILVVILADSSADFAVHCSVL